MIGYPHEDHFFYWLAYNIHFIATCAGVAIIQWLILRRRVSRIGWWAPAIIAGFVLASILLYALPITRKHLITPDLGITDILGWIMFLALGGTLAGVLQWLFLRRHVSRAGWWVLANAVGWSLAGMVLWLPTRFLFKWVSPYNWFLQLLLSLINPFLFFRIITGAVTGGALVWLLRQPVNVK